MLDRETANTIAEGVDMLKRVRLVLGGITIEAKSAHDVASIDSAIGNIINSFAQLLQENQQPIDNSTIRE